MREYTSSPQFSRLSCTYELNPLIESNETQTRIVSEIKGSGESASILSKWNIGLTVIVIALTVFALYMTWIDRGQSRNNARFMPQYAKQITEGLEDINQSISANNTSAESNLRDVLSEMKRNGASQDAKFDKLLAEQMSILKQLDQQYNADRKTIEDLKRTLSDLEIKIKNNEPKNTPVAGDR